MRFAIGSGIASLMRHAWLLLPALLLLCAPTAASAQVISYRLDVDGLGCPFRAYGLERALLAVTGVTRVEMALAEGIVVVHVAPDPMVTPDALEGPVGEAGIELRTIEATARGTVRGMGVWRRLIVGERSFFLLPGAASDRLEAMRAEQEDPPAVEVRGPVLRRGDRWAIEVEAVAKTPGG